MACAEPLVSIVIPAHQEENRIGATLDALNDYLAHRPVGDVEVIVVSDGSTDRTADIARQYAKRTSGQFTVLELPQAKGKGAAVRAGMLKAAGRFVLFTDADLAYEPTLFNDFVARLQAGADIVIAQRIGATEYSRLARRWLTAASRFVFERLITPGIADTQAGLKAFTRSAAQDLFCRQVIDGLIFDVEILMLARKRGYRVEKVYVDWKDKPGSTIKLGRASAAALLDLFRIWWRIRRDG